MPLRPLTQNHQALYNPLPLADFTPTSPSVTYLESGVSSTLAAATGWAFTRTTVGYAVNAAGDTATSFAIDAPRVTDKGLLIEAAATNRIWFNNAFANVYWTKNTMTIGTGIADPAGGTTASTFTATGAGSYVNGTVALAGSDTSANSVWLRRRTGTGTVQLGYPNGGAPLTVTLTSSWQKFQTSSLSFNTVLAFLAVWVNTSGDAVDVWLPQQEVGTVASSSILTPSNANVTRGADVATLTLSGTSFADVTANGVTTRAAASSPLVLGAASGAAWVGQYVTRVMIR